MERILFNIPDKHPFEITRLEGDIDDFHGLNIDHEGLQIKVYSGILYWFLTNRKVSKWVSFYKEVDNWKPPYGGPRYKKSNSRTIDGTQYIKYFATGYLEGIREFKTKYYTSNPDRLTALRLLDVYFNKENGLINVIHQYPVHVSEKAIKEAGYKAGLLAEMVKYVHLEYKSFFEDYLKENKAEKGKPQQSRITYQWLNDPDKEVPELYELMIQHKLIGLETTLEQFTAIFTGQPIESISPIKWTGGTTVLLAYFINKMMDKTKISGDTYLWSIGARCFIGADRKILGTSHNRSLNNINPDHPRKPKNHNVIDQLFT